jgi:hypothetical protein
MDFDTSRTIVRGGPRSVAGSSASRRTAGAGGGSGHDGNGSLGSHSLQFLIRRCGQNGEGTTAWHAHLPSSHPPRGAVWIVERLGGSSSRTTRIAREDRTR